MTKPKTASSRPYIIRQATREDLDGVERLLIDSDLPIEGLSATIDTLVVGLQGETIVGSAALEIFGEAALLRSVAVSSAARGNGLGQKLTFEALQLGARLGITRTFLLTETASDFFPRFGFEPVDRASIPPTVKSSVEFTRVCPESALAMERRTID